MADLHLLSVGIEFRHDEGFTIDRPRGSGDIVFVHFLTDVEVLTDNGIEDGRAGHCILYMAKHPHWYRGRNVGLGNDWFHAEGRALRSMIRRYGLPVNRLFRPHATGFVAPLLTRMQDELHAGRPHADASIRIEMERLLLQLSRGLHTAEEQRLSPRKVELIESFRCLRTAIHAELTIEWDVPSMAERVHLSESRFARLYKEFFGLPPREDLLQARLNRAEWLLESTPLPVGDIAEQAGFQSLYHFSRIFKRRTGRSPSDWRAHRAG